MSAVTNFRSTVSQLFHDHIDQGAQTKGGGGSIAFALLTQHPRFDSRHTQEFSPIILDVAEIYKLVIVMTYRELINGTS